MSRLRDLNWRWFSPHLSFGENMAEVWERIWLCEVQRVHRIKVQSYGRCIRCNRKVSQ